MTGVDLIGADVLGRRQDALPSERASQLVPTGSRRNLMQRLSGTLVPESSWASLLRSVEVPPAAVRRKAVPTVMAPPSPSIIAVPMGRAVAAAHPDAVPPAGATV
jgi:hypothetical protein